nr:transglycosylase domain-containing protein [Demequina litorisediminis]
MAAEDRTFYTNPGINIPGMVKALWDTVVLDQPRGGSSITQQYVERYYVGETTTSIQGKIKETLLAVKIDQEQTKDEVLENYLNTIYLGRGAYGIEAASREYYDKHAADLTLSEAAMLAGIVPAPSAWDPKENHDKAEQRWNYVLDGMVDADFISQTDRDAVTEFPEPIEYSNQDVFAGPEGYILSTALDEVEAETGISRDEIESQGYRVTTTIIPAHQESTEAAVAEMPDDHAENLEAAAVTIDATTGAITSMYGGADYLERQRNAVTQDVAQAGSTFKPFALVSALEQGIGLESRYLANNEMEFDGFDQPVRNFGGRSLRLRGPHRGDAGLDQHGLRGPERGRDAAGDHGDRDPGWPSRGHAGPRGEPLERARHGVAAHPRHGHRVRDVRDRRREARLVHHRERDRQGRRDRLQAEYRR